MRITSTMTARRAARAERRRIERELATYDTPAARLEIQEIFARHEGEEARELEAVLSRLPLATEGRTAA